MRLLTRKRAAALLQASLGTLDGWRLRGSGPACIRIGRRVYHPRDLAEFVRARRHATRSGRPIGRQPRLFDRMKALELRRQGYSYREIARLLKVPVATLYGALRRFCSENRREGQAAKLLENHDRVRQGVGV